MRQLIAVLLLVAAPAFAQTTPQQVQDKPLYNAIYAWIKPQLDALVARPAPADPTPGLAAILGAQQITNSKLDALIAAIKAGAITAPDVASTPTGTTTAAAVDYFPAQPGTAPFPSPENSSIIRVAGAVQGPAYLRDQQGTIHTLGPPGSATGTGWFMNGIEVPNYSGLPVTQLLVRAYYVYGKTSGGQWVLPNPGMGNNSYNASLPDAIVGTTAGGTTPTGPAVVPIAPSAPSPIQPGTSGRVLIAAPGTFATVLATAKDGDTIQVAGNYAETVPTINAAIAVMALPGAPAVFDFTHQTLAMGKGGFVPTRDFLLSGPITVMGAGVLEPYAGGTAAVRHGAAVHVTISGGVKLVGNQNGFAGGELPGSTLDMVDVTLDGNGATQVNNGAGDGQAHNMYTFPGLAYVHLTRVTSQNAKVGHELKLRSNNIIITDSTIIGAPAGTNPDDSTLIDLPDGGNLTIINSRLVKPKGVFNHGLIGLSMESTKLGAATLLVQGGTLDGECDSPQIMSGSPYSTATLNGVTMKGNPITGSNVSLTVH